MKPIGGEIAIKSKGERSFLTDSGRSSLRLFLRSNDFENKKFLIPDFFCSVIEDVLKEEKINYDFYPINDDLSIDSDFLKKNVFDVLYVINYFGQIQNLEAINLEDKILIEDNVFLYHFENNHNAKKWIGFNSFRKISPLTDGSLIKTNLHIESPLIKNQHAAFSDSKKEACVLKYEFLSNNKFSEAEYLELFEKAEKQIDEQTDIFTISSESLNLLFNEDFNQQEVLKKRYFELEKITNTKFKTPSYFSFFPFEIANKATFLKEMRSKNIFLPNFWPQTSQNNNLYTNLVVIPLFYNYSDEQFEYIKNELRIF